MIRVVGLSRRGKAEVWVRLFSDGRTLTKHRGGFDERGVYYDLPLPSGSTKLVFWDEVEKDLADAAEKGVIEMPEKQEGKPSDEKDEKEKAATETPRKDQKEEKATPPKKNEKTKTATLCGDVVATATVDLDAGKWTAKIGSATLRKDIAEILFPAFARTYDWRASKK